jgi:hypothetical protein
MSTFTKFIPLAVTSLLLVGCDTDSDNGDDQQGSTPDGDYSVMVVDATSGDAAYADFASGSEISSSDDVWHVAYQKYVGFSINGGVTGSGESAGCVAYEYDALYDDQGSAVAAEFESLTVTNTAAQFESIDINSCTTFTADSINAIIETDEWLDSETYGVIMGNGFVIQHDDGTNYSRISATNFEMVHGVGMKYEVSLAVEYWNGSSFDAATSIALDLIDATKQYYDIDTQSYVTESDAWDIGFVSQGRSMVLVTNGGVSGSGDGATAVLLVDSAFDVTDPTDVGYTGQVYTYSADSAESMMSNPGDYGALEYGAGGSGDHKMWPTFTIYLINDEATGITYKVQVVGNYGEDGTLASGNIVYRYQALN